MWLTFQCPKATIYSYQPGEKTVLFWACRLQQGSPTADSRNTAAGCFLGILLSEFTIYHLSIYLWLNAVFTHKLATPTSLINGVAFPSSIVLQITFDQLLYFLQKENYQLLPPCKKCIPWRSKSKHSSDFSAICFPGTAMNLWSYASVISHSSEEYMLFWIKINQNSHFRISMRKEFHETNSLISSLNYTRQKIMQYIIPYIPALCLCLWFSVRS